MKPAEELLRSMLDDNMEKFKATFGDTFNMKVQDITGKMTPDIVANLIKDPEEVEEVEPEGEDTDGTD
jgi:hypothetical protein|tara:strand:- start:167 stop:370 length:204 start_codon:yes stop_codon:yes gene_type:complete